MSTESYSNDETLLFFILIMVLQFAMIFFFQMSFVYTGFPKSWHVFYWCWAEPEKACASKCSQHLQGLGNPQAISGLITILILGESLCLSFLIIRISRHTSPLWLWSHLLCCRSVCVEAAPDQQPCRAQHRLGKLPQIHRQHSQQVLECCGHSVLHFLLGCFEASHSSPCCGHWAASSVCSEGWEMPAQPFPRAPQWNRLSVSIHCCCQGLFFN